MPTYEYACTACHHEWEAEQSIKDAPLTECPQCHAATAKRQISRGVGFILKGGGWYADLYSSSSNKPADTSSSSGSSSSGTSGSSGSSGNGTSGSSGSSSSGSSGGSSSGSSGSSSSGSSGSSSSAQAA